MSASGWKIVVQALADDKGAWVKDLSFVACESGKLRLGVPTPFLKAFIHANYKDVILAKWNQLSGSRAVALSLEVVALNAVLSSSPVNDESAFETGNEDAPLLPFLIRKQPAAGISIKLDAKFTFENFIVGSCNEFAYAAAKRVAEQENVGFNPLFLYSSTGLGKTHLLQAIAHRVAEVSPRKKVIYLTSERYLNFFLKATRGGDVEQSMAFKELFRSADILMIDDVQFLVGKTKTLEEFLHTFNELVEGKKQLILSASTAPAALDGLDSRLKTRMSSGLVVDIMPPSLSVRRRILAAKAETLASEVSDEVLDFVAEKTPSSIRDLEGALTRIIAHSELMGQKPSLERARSVLKDVLAAGERRVSIAEIKSKVAEFYNLRPTDLETATREKAVAVPRQVAMYLAKTMTTKSYPEIGREFKRDHTTILHGVKKIEKAIKENETLSEQISTLSDLLN